MINKDAYEIEIYIAQMIAVNNNVDYSVIKTKKESADSAEKQEKQLQERQLLENEYIQKNEDIISNKQPLKLFDLNFDSHNEQFGLPKKLQYNETELSYNIDKEALLQVFSRLNLTGRFC